MSTAEITHLLRISDLPKSKSMPFDVVFTKDQMAGVASIVSALAVKKLRISGKISPSGAKDRVLRATVGASVTQACVVTLEPVLSRIDIPVTRSYVADYRPESNDSVTEMTSDDTIEPLSDEIDLAAIAIEAVALALPDYPKRPDARLETAQFAARGVAPMRDEDTKPFASLAGLKDKLAKEDK